MPTSAEDAARRFYGDALGMSEESKPDPLRSRGGVWFRHGTTVVHLGVDPEFRPQKKGHPGFLVTDLDALGAALTDAGFSVEWDHSLPERRRFYVADPFGNRLEFLQDGNGFSQDP